MVMDLREWGWLGTIATPTVYGVDSVIRAWRPTDGLPMAHERHNCSLVVHGPAPISLAEQAAKRHLQNREEALAWMNEH